MKADLLIVVGALLGGVLAAALLLRDLRGHPPRVFVAPVGYLEQTQNTVQQRDSSSPIFQQVQPEGIVRNGDVVRTGARSGAILRINDGTSIELAELSMVSVDVSKEGMIMRFEGRGLRLQRNGANSRLSLETRQGRLIVEDADVRVLRDGLKIFVDRGGVTSRSSDGETRTLAPLLEPPLAADNPFISPQPNRTPRFSSIFSDQTQSTPIRPSKPLVPPDMADVEVHHGQSK